MGFLKMIQQKNGFQEKDFIVYPTHGVGKIKEIVKENIANTELECYVIEFEREKLTMSVPVKRALKSGMRKLSTTEEINEVFEILKNGVKKTKGMWSRRAQEYEEKINTGDIFAIAEVLRDLTRDVDDADRSYSERIIYETALYRISSEYSVIEGLSFEEAKERVVMVSKDKIDLAMEKKIANEE
jgi:CarD family transcriptional regulator